jgi:hypothetical protein
VLGLAVAAFVNHELTSGSGYAYSLANGTELTGARISRFDIQTRTADCGLYAVRPFRRPDH